MNSTERLPCVLMLTSFPALRQPKPEIADRGTVRLGSGMITAGFPALRQPRPEIADRGTVRLGSGMITADSHRAVSVSPVLGSRSVGDD
jgi:hypothetical protein